MLIRIPCKVNKMKLLSQMTKTIGSTVEVVGVILPEVISSSGKTIGNITELTANYSEVAVLGSRTDLTKAKAVSELESLSLEVQLLDAQQTVTECKKLIASGTLTVDQKRDVLAQLAEAIKQLQAK